MVGNCVERFIKIFFRHILDTFFEGDHNIKRLGVQRGVFPKPLTGAPTQSIAYGRALVDFFGHDKRKTGMRNRVSAYLNSEKGCFGFPPTPKNVYNIVRRLKPKRSFHTSMCTRKRSRENTAYTDTFFLPFARLRATTRIPLALLILRINPCVLLLFLFDG